MAAFKNKTNGTWYVQFRYTDWKGERQQKLKRGSVSYTHLTLPTNSRV